MNDVFNLNLNKTIVLIGMMGVGKTSIGRRLSKKLSLNFIDSDQEVEAAAKCSVTDIFEIYGEAAFRDVERRVISRLLSEKPMVLATGGGAFADEETREIIKDQGISIWLKADPDTLIPRIERRDHRPQFSEGNTEDTLHDLLEKYTPLYSQADLHIDCTNSTPEETTERIILELNKHISKLQAKDGKKIQHV